MSGLSYSPPLYYFNNITYDPAFFANNNGITLAYLNQTFLPRIGIALSTATLTSFQGPIECYGLVSFLGGLSITGGLTLDTLTVNGLATFNTAPLLSGSGIYSNTIPAASLVNGSLTQAQVSTGLQFVNLGIQNFGGAKTFNNLLSTTGINDTVSITTPTMNTNNITTSASTALKLNIGTVSLPSGTDAGSGLQLCWNGIGSGTGETDFVNLGQGTGVAGGGFNFSTLSNSITNTNLAFMGKYANQGLTLFSGCGKLRINDRNGGAFWWGQSQEGSQTSCSVNGVSTSFTVDCGNSSAVNSTCLSLNTTSATITPPLNTSSTITSTGIISAPNFTATNSLGTTSLYALQTGNITAGGLTTFNVNHPTTSLGNNISTNTTQYSTVGYVNSVSGPTLLNSNNIWTGTNAFTKPYISISNVTAPINIGSGTGNSGNVIIGNSACLSTVTTNSGSVCIGGGLSSSLNLSTGTGNICVGNSSATLLTTGNNNLFYGNGCGTTISTASNNTILGAGAWSTGTANFSNCTCIGQNCDPPTANNSIVLGTVNETLYVNGAANLNNSLLSGTTVCAGNVLQVNNQIKRFHTTYTTGVANTITNPLPFMILFTPTAGMSFTFPIPSVTNAGQTFILRKDNAGVGSVTFSCTGNPLVWVPLNSGTANSSLTINTVWQFTIYSTGSVYLQIA